MQGGNIGNITGDFVRNYAEGVLSTQGGAIFNDYGVSIKDITGSFTDNYVKSSSDIAQGGAIYNSLQGGVIGNITGDFVRNYAEGMLSAHGGAIFNEHRIGDITNSSFVNNHVKSETGEAYGGAIYNAKNGNLGNIYNSSFIGNYAESQTGEAYGGAIYTTTNLNIFANDGYMSVIKDNYTKSQDVKNDSAIYLDKGVTLKLEMNNGGSFYLGDKIDSSNPMEVFLASNNYNNFEEFAQAQGFKDTPLETFLSKYGNGAKTFEEYVANLNCPSVEEFLKSNNAETIEEFLENGPKLKGNSATEQFVFQQGCSSAQEFVMNVVGPLSNVQIKGDSAKDTTFYLFNDIPYSHVTTENTTLNTIDNNVRVYNFGGYQLTGDTNFVADVDLAAKEMDRLTAYSYDEHQGSLNVIGMNLLSDANMDEDVTAIYFAEPGLKDNVVNGTGELPDSNFQTAYTPIYKYNVTYDNENQYDGKGDGGYFLFTRGDKILTPGGDIGGSTGNPSDAFNPAVLSTPVANLAAGQAAMNEAFKYVFEHADSFTQLPAMERYAKINANKYALSTDFNDNMPDYSVYPNKGIWFRPYTTFESMNIKNGPDVDAITYGSLVGFDGDFKEMKNGWHRVFTGYAGYMGSSLNYSGVDTTMNGGLLGFTETFYKGNFWTAITASAGASVGESHSMYGKEDYTSLLAGVGSKTGYNFEFKDGKFIIQPIMFLSYTFVNTFDYKNAAGVNIESDPLHTIQLNPSVRFIANLKGGWQPYASVGMVWNLMNESKVTANNVRLPEMSVKPYVEYGVGVQRNWADKFTAFLQAMIRNGGRNGVSLTGGFRFMLGSDDDNDSPKVKKEIKSL